MSKFFWNVGTTAATIFSGSVELQVLIGAGICKSSPWGKDFTADVTFGYIILSIFLVLNSLILVWQK